MVLGTVVCCPGLGVARIIPHGQPLTTMIALITEKLQKQCLDEVTNGAAVPLSTSQQPLLGAAHQGPLSTAHQPPLFAAHQVPLLYKDGDHIPNSEKVPLSVKGKNVWTTPITISSVGRGCDSSSDSNKSCDETDEHVRAVLCSHANVPHKCFICDMNSNKAPPNKRQCRSVSVPVDSMASSPWQPDRLWRPIAVIPMSRGAQQSPDLMQSRCHDFKASYFSRMVHSTFSTDSGHFTTSDFQTPPCSPVPRPVSALSSFSQMVGGAPWLDNCQHDNHRFEILQKRSLSYEEEVSLGATSSTPSSPYRHKIPRCRSQPCILHDRRVAKKRRREGFRPTINFQKMTETAYNRYRRSDPVFTPGAEFQNRNSLFSHGLDAAMNLMPIASSPLDTDIPIRNLGERHTRVMPLDPSDMSTDMADSCEIDDIQQPVRLIGDDDPESGCGCHGDDLEDDPTELFQLTDLDIEQIENH